MNKFKSLLFILIVLYFSTASIYSNNIKNNFKNKIDSLYNYSVKLIYPEELNLILNNDNIVILDTRSIKEFEVSHINGAHLIDYKSFSLSNLPKIDRDSKIVIYCTIGYRSEKIGELLIDAGYSDVNNLYGGLINWTNNNYIVVNKNGLVKKIHTYSFLWKKYLTNKEFK